jgi:two-component system phosphate regulon sensor histidine kinase PhoR
VFNRSQLALALGGATLLALVLVFIRHPLVALVALCGVAAGACLARLAARPVKDEAQETIATQVEARDEGAQALTTKPAGRIEASAAGGVISPGALLDATMDSMREGMLVVDQELRIVASNRAARDIFATGSNTLEAKRLSEVTRQPAIYQAFRSAMEAGERAETKVEMQGADKRIFDLRVAPLRFGKRGASRGAIGVFFDITRLERLERVRQEFLSNVSHELRTPLTAIIAFVETLEEGAIDDEENNRRFLAVIRRNATRMHNLIDDILELSAIEAGTVSVEPQTIRLRPLVEEVATALASRAAPRSVTLHNEVAPEAVVYADGRRLEQMLANLIDNAIKFNHAGGSVRIQHEGGERDRISIIDTGDGISAEHIKRIFERFYRVDRARSREMGGTGLGLAIVKHLARAHGGEAAVHSIAGGGATFTIELPKAVTSDKISDKQQAMSERKSF